MTLVGILISSDSIKRNKSSKTNYLGGGGGGGERARALKSERKTVDINENDNAQKAIIVK